MTCIVGFRNKGKVYIGGDSAASGNGNIDQRKDEKIFKNGKFVFGCTDSYRMMQLLRYTFKPPPINKKDLYKYLCTDFINEIRKVFSEGGWINNRDGVDGGGTFLIGYKDRLFAIYSDFQVAEHEDIYMSVGSGSEFALGSFYTMLNLYPVDNYEDLTPKDFCTNALNAATHHNCYVSAPYIILNT